MTQLGDKYGTQRSAAPPCVLVIDDLFGREVEPGVNCERGNLCGNFLLRDCTNGTPAQSTVVEPVADVTFCRGQTPIRAKLGDDVENDVEGAMRVVESGWPTGAVGGTAMPWAMVLLDLCFYTGRVTDESHRRTPGMPEGRPGDNHPARYFGLTLLDAIHRMFPELPVVILSSKSRDEVSLEFSRRGALGFIARDDLRGPELLREALRQHGLIPDSDGDVIGRSLPLLLALREARRTASHGENVLVRGERGTGKELMARYLHRAAACGTENPFVPVNAAILTPQLFASELFGIEPKTATGVEGKTGLIALADGGDLFLDEIADMPPQVQASLLRVLQDGQIVPVGSREATAVVVRFISATNAEIERTESGLREDLLDRLRLGGTIYLPALRERKEDIPLLARQFVAEAIDLRSGMRAREITNEAINALQDHDWPGNVRELRSCVFDAINRYPDVEYLVPTQLRIQRPAAATKARPVVPQAAPPTNENGFGAMLKRLRDFEFSPDRINEWSGRIGELQLEQSRLLAKYLGAALQATKRRTPEYPEGKIQIHPAVKLLTSDSKLTGSKAADYVKRILGPIAQELTAELAEAYDTALRLRPKSASTRTKSLKKKA